MAEVPFMARRYGIPWFLDRLDCLAAKNARAGKPTPELKQERLALRQEGNAILQTILEEKNAWALMLLPWYLKLRWPRRSADPPPVESIPREMAMLSLQEIDHIFRDILVTEVPDLSRRYGIPECLERLDHLAAKTAREGAVTAEMERERLLLQQEAASILQCLVDNGEEEALDLLPGYLSLGWQKYSSASPLYDWEIWWLDTFDSDTSISARSRGVRNGLCELWQSVIFSIEEDGRASFNRFTLVWEYESGRRTQIEIPVLPVDPNPVLAKLLSWVFPPASEEFRARIKKEGCSAEDWPGRNGKILERLAEWHLQLLKVGDRWGEDYYPGREAAEMLERIAVMQGPKELFDPPRVT